MPHKDDYNLEEKIKITFKGMPYYVMPRYRNHYVENDYEKFSLQLLKNDLDAGKVFLDIGAHYGAYSLYAAQAAGSTVFAVEPVDENFQLLNANVLLNKLQGQITTYNYAVSDQDGEASFNIPWASDSAGFYEHPNAETIRVQKVQVRAIDNLLPDARIDFIKIDTEGHEISVLKGLQRTLDHNPQAKLIIELNPECLKRAGKSVDELLKVIYSYDKDMYIVDEEQFCLIRLSSDLTGWERYVKQKGYANLYCIPRTAKQEFLLFVSHSPRLDGAERALVEQVCALRERGIMSHVFVPESGPLEKLLVDRGIGNSVTSEPYSFWVDPDGDNSAHERRERQSASNMLAATEITTLAGYINPTAIVNNSIVNPWGYVASRALGLPLIWMVHEYGDLDHDLPFYHDIQTIRQFVVRESAAVFCCSDSVKQSLLTGDAKLDKKIGVTYNLLDQERVLDKATEKIPTPFSRTKGVKLCMVGTIQEGKGQITAIRAIHELAKQKVAAHLVILGQGRSKYVASLKRLVKELKLEDRVSFIGYMPNPYPYMRAADALLVCSNNEAFGRTAAEAMLVGTPVIGTNAGGIAELIVNNQTGLLFKPLDFLGLAQQIQKLGKLNTAKMTRAAREFVSKLLNADTILDEEIKRIAKIRVDQQELKYGKLMNQEWIDTVRSETKRIEELSALQMVIQQLQAENRSLMELNHEIRTNYDRVLHSRSWKLTRPLRKSSAIVKRLKK